MESFDVVVIGSGFGGSVTVYRAAEAGHTVCLLERGRAYPPNSFARSPYSLDRAFWDPGNGRTGLYDLWSFGHMDGIVSAGLGGGSLIYANVMIRKDENWFVRETAEGIDPWPVTRAQLDPHYDAVEAIIKPQTYPLDKPPYDEVRKAVEFRQAAVRQGFTETTYDNVDPGRRQWYLPLLAVTFANEGQDPVPGQAMHEEIRNLHDRDRQTCRLTGECDLGCTYGAKNSLDYNYLTLLSKKPSASIRTLSEAKTITRVDGGFTVDYRRYDGSAPTDQPAEFSDATIGARHLVLSAGTFGTNRLLLRNQAALGIRNPQLGRYFSGNGDLLTMVLEAREGSGDDERNRILDPSHGAVITSTLRIPDERDGANAGDRGFYLQDAGYPVVLDWLVQTASLVGHPMTLGRFIADRLENHLLHHGDSHLAPAIEALLADTSLSAGSMPLLGMGHDVPSGVFSLDAHGELSLDWDKGQSTPFFTEAVEVSKGIAERLHGQLLENPLTSVFGRLITVHPLGGCSMGETAAQGVVDPWGRVYDCPGLHIADGSVMPGPVGANPSWTIAALADRFADALIDDLA